MYMLPDRPYDYPMAPPASYAREAAGEVAIHDPGVASRPRSAVASRHGSAARVP